MIIEKTNEQIKETIINNIIKMLKTRNILNNEEYIENENIIEFDNNKIVIGLYINYKLDNLQHAKILSTINKYSKESIKIIVVESYVEKIYNDLKLLNFEVFDKNFFLINIIDHIASPKYELINNKTECDNILSEYQTKKAQMQKILITDKISLYYNAKKENIFRIIRNSNLTGYSITYRIVI